LEQGSENGIVGTVESEDFAGPEKQMEQKTMKELLVQSLESLTEKEKKVILLYYYEELTLKEISEVLEVSESRISQLHTKAIQKLRLKLGNQIEIFF
jgi:RNA polymerase sigma factor for flagellar operon FliA